MGTLLDGIADQGNVHSAVLHGIEDQGNVHSAGLGGIADQGNVHSAALYGFEDQGNVHAAGLDGIADQGKVHSAVLHGFEDQGNVHSAGLGGVEDQGDVHSAVLHGFEGQGIVRSAGLDGLGDQGDGEEDLVGVFVASESGLAMDRFYDTLLLLGGARGWVTLELIGRVLNWEHELLEEYAGFWHELDVVELDGERVSFCKHVFNECNSHGLQQSPTVMSR